MDVFLAWYMCHVSFTSFHISFSPFSLFLSYIICIFVNASMEILKHSLAFLWHPATTDEDIESLLKSDDGGAFFSSKYALPTTASRSIKKAVIALLPNPIQRYLAPNLYKPSRIHPTSYLDGLRGMCFAFSSSSLSSSVLHYKRQLQRPCNPEI